MQTQPLESIRPVTPRLMIESLRVANLGTVDALLLSRSLWISKGRAVEIIRQLRSMQLIEGEPETGRFRITSNGRAFLQAESRKDRAELHRILMAYEPYALIHNALESESADISKLTSTVGINRVGIETILRLLSWASGRVRRNRTTGAYYVSTNVSPTSLAFLDAIRDAFQIATRRQFGIRREHLTIPELRQHVCERLHLDSGDFNKMLEFFVRAQPGLLELSSAPAPVTNSAKDKGLLMGGRHYFYVRILSGGNTHGN